MALRTGTPLNRLAEAIVTRLEDISHRKDADFLTTPRSVKRLTLLGDFAGLAKPVLSLTVLGCEFEPQGGQRFEGTVTFGVHCVTENTANAEGALLDLVSDVLFALASVVHVPDPLGEPQAVYLFPRNFEPNADLSNRTGLAVTTLTFECRYKFDSIAP